MDGVLVDVKLSENKYLGPGMLRDIFSKISKVQGTVVIDKVSESLCARYPGKIIKPSRYRFKDIDGVIKPLYARL